MAWAALIMSRKVFWDQLGGRIMTLPWPKDTVFGGMIEDPPHSVVFSVFHPDIPEDTEQVEPLFEKVWEGDKRFFKFQGWNPT
jgi:hypothetical protein